MARGEVRRVVMMPDEKPDSQISPKVFALVNVLERLAAIFLLDCLVSEEKYEVRRYTVNEVGFES